MSHPSSHLYDSDDDYEQVLMKPRPRQPFELSSPPPSGPSTPSANHSPQATYLQPPASMMDSNDTPSRNRSFLNLTTSTLFGIYQPTGYNNEREEMTTPWGTGAQTPAMSRQGSLDMSRVDRVLTNGSTAYKTRRKQESSQRVHHKPRRGFTGYYLPLFGRELALFGVGVLYSLLITHLHDRSELAPAKVDINRSSWLYLACWGLAGIALGEALPWADTFWAPETDRETNDEGGQKYQRSSRGVDGWMDIVRSIGAFVGIAFAIRKLPWQSTLQLSLTLALANPAIWFIVDRSPPGFVLSTCFALAGTLVLLGMNPALMPSPSPAEVLRSHVQRNGGLGSRIANSLESEELILGIFTQDSVGVATWIASVLFVSSVCFGNIGRRLALSER